MASLATIASTFTRRVVAGLAAITAEPIPAPVVEVPTAAPAAPKPASEAITPTPAPVAQPTRSATRGAALLALLGADADEADRMMADFMAAATGTPVEAVTPAEVTAVEPQAAHIKPAPAREFFAPADMPTVDAIEAEAVAFDEAADKYRAGDRGKNRARKLLDKVPAGRYGRALVEWIPSNTDRADLDAIEAIFKAHNLGPVPMKRDRDSLKVTILPA